MLRRMDEQTIGRSLLAAFAEVPDPRRPRGRRHPLPALLALSTAAMLSGARSLYAIAQWGRLQPPAVAEALGFTREQTPCVATLHRAFKALDASAFEAALAGWAQGQLGDRWEAVALDGKALRGIHREELPGVRLVAAYCDRVGLVLIGLDPPIGPARGRTDRRARRAGRLPAGEADRDR